MQDCRGCRLCCHCANKGEAWGQQLWQDTPQDLTSQCAFVQVLFSASIEENIRFGRPEATIEEVREAALAANAGFVDTLPEGFSTQVC